METHFPYQRGTKACLANFLLSRVQLCMIKSHSSPNHFENFFMPLSKVNTLQTSFAPHTQLSLLKF